jgi:hypothetical protein
VSIKKIFLKKQFFLDEIDYSIKVKQLFRPLYRAEIFVVFIFFIFLWHHLEQSFFIGYFLAIFEPLL